MQDNENKINGENTESASASQSNNSADNDDAVKAFDWSYTDNAQESSATPITENKGDEDENKQENTEDEQSSDTQTDSSQDNKTDNENEHGGSAQKDRERRSNPALLLSITLSGCAIILLIALAIISSLGLFSGGNGGVVFIPVASPSGAEEHDSSSDMLESFLESVVVIKCKVGDIPGVGTGIILSEDGYIVTNHHVIEGANDIYVWLYNNDTPQKATVIGYREIDDIAVLKINKTGLKPATFAKSSECRIGERVYAVGTPEGNEFGWSVTQGIISCPDREIKIYKNDGTLKKKMNVIQTDAPVNPGNSGGPLINSRGEVVGIVTLKLTDSAGMGFALPSDGALLDIKSIIERGHANDVNSGISVGRPLIGITGVGVVGDTWYENYEEDGVSAIREVSEEEAAQNPETTFYAAITGVRISAVSNDLDAKNKLREGDIITKVNNIKVTNIYEVMTVINDFNGGDNVTITFWRDGTYSTVTITLGTEQQ